MTTRILVTDEQILSKFYDLVDRFERFKLNDAGVVAEMRALFARPAPAPCCCDDIDEDLRPCEPCWLRLSPAAREGV